MLMKSLTFFSLGAAHASRLSLHKDGCLENKDREREDLQNE